VRQFGADSRGEAKKLAWRSAGLQGEYHLWGDKNPGGKSAPLTAGHRTGELSAVPESCRIAVKAIPNAPRSALAGWVGDTLKVKVHAPALDGRANEALREFLAGELGIKTSAVSVLQGAKSRLKLVEVSGFSLAEARARLSAH
jgi:uncharacterized protein YggU (UPF0235/DUF167 family)